jgi:hypothetical protein
MLPLLRVTTPTVLLVAPTSSVPPPTVRFPPPSEPLAAETSVPALTLVPPL